MSKTPEVGELVVGRITSVKDYGAYLEVDEYPGYEGFIHVSEVSLKWVRNIREHLKEGQRVVLKIIRVNPQTNQIDLSMRRVSQKEKVDKLLEVKKKTKVLKMFKALESSGSKNIVEKLIVVYPNLVNLYDCLERIASGEDARNFFPSLSESEEENLKKAVEQEIKVREVEMRVDVIMRCDGPKGLEAIRQAAEKAEQVAGPAELIEITTKGAPVYSVLVKASSKERASELLSKAFEACQMIMTSFGGSAQLKESAR
ncbi:MAG: S1 RNA-binding domain-containing protein [Candidatus Caldarchaeum sp.]|nr:S1 RNA-binding domain-containing protein [Candidatus Caldarchaeum sp.]MDW8360255.1 S1 RNA-binding domain-containing protein [Candidatus Caldarchaeum sp.]